MHVVHPAHVDKMGDGKVLLPFTFVEYIIMQWVTYLALHTYLFWFLCLATILFYCQQHGQTIRLPTWKRSLMALVKILLFFASCANRINETCSKSFTCPNQSLLGTWVQCLFFSFFLFPHMTNFMFLFLESKGCFIPLQDYRVHRPDERREFTLPARNLFGIF